MDPLAKITKHAQAAHRELAERDQAIVEARAAGCTWASIAAAAGLTQHGCAKIYRRVAGT